MRSDWRLHPDLESLDDILEPTLGLPIFQEDIMKILAKICSWNYGQADLVFNALRKKDQVKLQKAKPDFYAAATESGYSQEAVDVLWQTLLPFADYSFGLAHSTGYAVLAYQSAYLKTHHPVEYMSALLTGEASDPEKLQEYLNETQRLDIPILGPDINGSGRGFSPDAGSIRYGLAAIKGVGDKAYAAIEKRRPYRSLHDFFKRADAKVLNIGTLSALIRSGALDTLCSNRGALLADSQRLADLALQGRAKEALGDSGLFSQTYQPIHQNPALDSVLQQWERETLGVTLTHPTLTITITEGLDETEWVYLRETLLSHPGSSPVIVQFSRWHSRLRISVTLDDGLKGRLTRIGGVVLS